MGANLVYLNKPNKKKTTSLGQLQATSQNRGYAYVASEMQGWRLNMEDAKLTLPLLEPDLGLFAIFDGHGGVECSKYCEQYFTLMLKEQPEFKSRQGLGTALENTFQGLDYMLTTPRGLDALARISKENP